MEHLMIGVVERATGEIVQHQVLSSDAGEDLIQKWRERLMLGRDPYEFTTTWWKEDEKLTRFLEKQSTQVHPVLLNKPTLFSEILRRKL